MPTISVKRSRWSSTLNTIWVLMLYGKLPMMANRPAGEAGSANDFQVEPQHIADDEPFVQRGKVFQDVGRSLPVQFHAPEVDVRAGDQVLRERAGAGPHLDHVAIAPVVRERPAIRRAMPSSFRKC